MITDIKKTPKLNLYQILMILLYSKRNIISH